jgi:Family of unknown function (DUF6152)
MPDSNLRAGVCTSLLAVFSLLTASVEAHHPILAKFDDAQTVRLEGRVTAIDWSSPHAHVFMNVIEDGEPVNWAIELESPVILEWSGWGPESLRVGESIRVVGIAARNGSHQAWSDTMTRRNGNTVFAVPEDLIERKLANRPAGLVPRWPDNQPRLGPPPGATGFWLATSASGLVEEGVKVPMDAYGMLKNIEDAAKVAPFMDWSRDLYKLRQATHGRDDPLFQYCIPPGGPREFQSPHAVQFVEQRSRGRIIVLMSGGNGNWRMLYTDGRTEVSQVSGNDDNPLFYGRSTATWEDDTLVVDTTGFNEGFWFANGGLPHTSLLSLTERFTRRDLNTLHYEVTVNDPGAYTRPWTSSWDLQWVPGEELFESYCQDNRP